LFFNIHNQTKKMRKNLLLNIVLVVLAVTVSIGSKAQYYSLSVLNSPGNPGGVNTDPDFNTATGNPPAGITTIYTYGSGKAYKLTLSKAQTIPFTFNFNGGPVTQFKVSSSGYVTFSKTATTPVGPTNSALPTVGLPDSTICVWGLAGAGLGGQIYSKVYGTAPHRQLWVNWWFAGNPTDTNSQNMWAIVLEETTNNIYLVDEFGIGNTTSSTGAYNPINLSLGVQINSTTAYGIAGSPNIQSLTSSPANSDNDYYEFVPGTQPAYDASVTVSNINNVQYYGVGVPYTVTANVSNLGADTLKSFNLNWSVNGSAPSIDNVTGASIASTPSVQYDSVTHTIQWTPSAIGSYTMKIWADNLNVGNVDQNHLNDTLIISNIQVIDSVQPKMVMFEEFMQASCDPCLNAAPNLDSVLTNNMAINIPARYHMDFPGTDYMNDETDAIFVVNRQNYYGVNSIPDAKIDGSTDVDPAAVNSANIQSEEKKGSPFKIKITSCTYDVTLNQYNLSASITAYANIASGFVAQTLLTIDTIKYAADQSTEDPVSYFGPGSYYPSSWLQYVLNFPQVVVDMLPTSSGSALTAFTSGSSQTINVSWTKNRPWGSEPKTYLYDSVGSHMTVFIQDNTTKYIYQAATAVPTSFVGINELSNNAGSMDVYPNPSNSNTYVVYNLNQGQNVAIEVWNELGQKIMDLNNGEQTAGKHEVVINKGNLQPGMYFVRMVTTEGTAVQKLEIQ
jgi:hypothetical protein